MSLDDNAGELPLESVGARLRRAREAAGLSRADVARQTRISERMLFALEEGNYTALPARTYATGFARTYARAVGLDPDIVVGDVRRDLDGAARPAEHAQAPTFEPGDPARVPSRRLAWSAVAVLVLALIALATWRASTMPASGLPSILPPEAPATPPPAPHPTPTPQPPAPQPTGPVVFTAEAPAWVQITAGGQDLLKHEMKAGESFTLPADAVDPRLRTGRPDALAITIGGQSVPKLADKQTVVTNVPVTAAALLARAAPPSPAATPAITPAPTLSPANAAPAARPPVIHTRPHPRPRPTTSPDATPPVTAPAEPSTTAP